MWRKRQPQLRAAPISAFQNPHLRPLEREQEARGPEHAGRALLRFRTAEVKLASKAGYWPYRRFASCSRREAANIGANISITSRTDQIIEERVSARNLRISR